jgi:hypothetical protein
MPDDRDAERKMAKKADKRHKRLLGQRFDNTHVKVAREAFPEKRFKPEPGFDHAILPFGTVPTLAEYMRTHGKQAPDNLLDNMILSLGNSSMPFNEISELTNMTVAQVEKRYKELLRDSNTFSSADMRLMMTQQLRALLNAMHNSAKAGSTEHAKIMIAAIERLNKMYELELQQTKVTVELVTNEQTVLITGLLQLVVERIMGIPEIAKAVRPEIIDGVVIEVLDEASAVITAAQDRQLTA